MKYFVLVILISFYSFVNLDSDNPTKEIALSYVETYHELAVLEMYRTGIPASITLAQGLHESNYGLSDLATKANNHFGIKCKSYWQGKTFSHKDDDRDEFGKITESCFRAYESAIDSYVDHSNFLSNTAHYQHCFQFDKTDYINWAISLKSCGYATDPKYAEKLIKKIRLFDLHQYDIMENPLDFSKYSR